MAQYPAYSAMAYDAGILKKGTNEADQVDQALVNCMPHLENPRVTIGECENVLNTVLRVTNDRYGLSWAASNLS